MNTPDHPEYLSHRVKRLSSLLIQHINEALKPYGLARSQWQVLSRVSRAGTLSQRDLQQAMRVEAATLTGIVDVLEAKGWIERLESPTDKRCRVLHVTPSGAELMASIPDPHEEIEARMLEGLSEDQRKRAERLLETMIRNLEKKD